MSDPVKWDPILDQFSMIRPDFLYSLVFDNFFQRSNVEGQNKNKNEMSQNKVISILNMK